MKKEPGKYVRSLIIITSICILSFTCASFLLSDDKYKITSGIITLLLVVVILVLSESFNNLSLGKILSLSREVENKESEKKEAKKESEVLRHELLKIVSNVQQSQVNNTFNAPPEYWTKGIGVVPSDKSGADLEDDKQEEVNDKIQGEEGNKEDGISGDSDRKKRLERIKRISIHFKKTKKVGLHKYLLKLSPLENDFLKDVEFSSAFNAIDPIMDIKTVFDGYVSTGTSELFISVINSNNPSPYFNYHLYVMLSKINFYSKAKKSDCRLVLIIVTASDYEEEVYNKNRAESMLGRFQPAIRNGLLEIKNINVSNDDITDYENHKREVEELKNEDD